MVAGFQAEHNTAATTYKNEVQRPNLTVDKH